MRHPLILFVLGFLVTSTFAQTQQTNPADPQEELQQLRGQVFQNMLAKGINPQDFFQQMRQQMEDGTFDPAQLQKSLIEKGVLDQATADRMQVLTQSSTFQRIRHQLNATDDEWKVIQPKVLKVLNALAESAPPAQAGGMRLMLGAMGGSGAVSKAMKDLRTAVNDPKTSPQTLELRLRVWRSAHEKAQSDLSAAQKDLASVLTARQEATLSMMGLLP